MNGSGIYRVCIMSECTQMDAHLYIDLEFFRGVGELLRCEGEAVGLEGVQGILADGCWGGAALVCLQP